MAIHTGKYALITFFKIQILEIRTKIENPKNLGKCGRPACGSDSLSNCQTARNIAFGANREAITLGSNG